MDDHDHSGAKSLRGIAAVLIARGLEVTETSADGMPELAITNPADPAGAYVRGLRGFPDLGVLGFRQRQVRRQRIFMRRPA